MSNHNSGGFTLIEVMVAMLISLVGLLGLLQSINIATEQNLRNASRDEALQIAENYMSQIRATPFALISSNLGPPYPTSTFPYGVKTVASNLRGVSKSYKVNRDVTALSDSSKLVQVRARWKFKNASTSQILQTVVSMPTQSN
jgi:type IV pilus assembly protein PilV